MIKLPKSSSSIRKPGRRSAIVAILTAASLSGCGGGGGGSAGDSASLAPAAISTAIQTVEDIPVSGALNASDPNGDPLVFSIVEQSVMGIASLTDAATGTFTYNPNPDSAGTDNFSFKVNDGSSDSNVATVTVTILATDDAPVAEDMGLTTTEDIPVANTLVATDAEQQPLTYSIVKNGTLGTATITDAATGAFDYAPDPDANGSDTFTFKASDGLNESNVATVSIDITPINDPPTATGNCSTTPQSQTLNGTFTATDPESPTLLMYSLANGSAGPFITANGGEVTIIDPTSGDFTYSPGTGSNGSRGRDTFTYRVTDPDGEIDSATETVIVDQAVMPVGDSITAGRISDAVGPPEPLRAGYRKPLQDTLTASGATFDFVGSVDHGWDLPDFDYNHEGHGGWPPADIAWGQNGGYPTDGVRAWLDSNPADIVLLHIGTIGVDRSYDIDVEAILDEIDVWEASANGNPVTVILALIIDRATIEPEVTAYNNNLLTLANNRIAAGDDIIVVDQHSALTYPDDIEDNTHPTAVGYSKMSPVWFNALTDVVDKCP